MHKKENMGLVELATVSFGQSFQITPIQLITTASSIVNGGNADHAPFWRAGGERGRRRGPRSLPIR
ncbi:MAG: penicillin-binding transpeptidase domain-containing protein [Clostridium fessum]